VAEDRCLDGLLGVEAANWQGSYALTEHVLSLGHRRIAYIAGPRDVRTTQDRLRGFQDAMERASLDPVAIRYGTYTYDAGYRIATEILENASVDVLMAGDDLVALGALRAAESRGLHVPDDLGVTGFDSVPLLSLIHPTLTSVRIPVFDIGRESMAMLVRHIGSSAPDEDRKVLDVEIIPGGSCISRTFDNQPSDSPLIDQQEHEGGGCTPKHG
jgi:DNA-binding LacI/PurR family transcriptional regulator